MDSNHGRGKNHDSSNRSSKHSDSRPDGSRSINPSDDHRVRDNGSGNRNHPESHLDLISRSNFIQLGNFNRSGIRNNRPQAIPKVIANGTNMSRSSSSSSSLSSSSSMSSEDLIELNANEEMKSSISNENNRPLLNISVKSGELLQGSPDNNTPVSQVSTVTHESVGANMMSPIQSPAIQVMDRGGYDQHRIPSSVFERTKSTAGGALDWSEASNESLFSLQIGNDSFSRVHAFHYNELHQSGQGELFKSGELIAYSPSLQVQEADSEGKNSDWEEKKSGETEATTIGNDSEEKFSNAVVSWNSLTNSNISDQTANNTHSFPFPIRKKKKKKKNKCGRGWLCCNCSKYSWALCCNNNKASRLCGCHCCSCRLWPSCCHCSRSCSHCWSCWSCSCKSCCYNSPSSTLKVRVTSDEIKRDIKEQNLQPISEATPKWPSSSSSSSSSSCNKWFCCFPSCPRCCSCPSCSSCSCS